MTTDQAQQYMSEGCFARGSTKPKIEAYMWFLEKDGKPAIIADPANIERTLEGMTATRIVP